MSLLKEINDVNVLRTGMKLSIMSGNILAANTEYAAASKEYIRVSDIALELSERCAANNDDESKLLAEAYRNMSGIYAGRASDPSKIRRN